MNLKSNKTIKKQHTKNEGFLSPTHYDTCYYLKGWALRGEKCFWAGSCDSYTPIGQQPERLRLGWDASRRFLLPCSAPEVLQCPSGRAGGGRFIYLFIALLWPPAGPSCLYLSSQQGAVMKHVSTLSIVKLKKVCTRFAFRWNLSRILNECDFCL